MVERSANNQDEGGPSGVQPLVERSDAFSTEKQPPTRWKQKHEEMWVKNKRKKRKNAGQKYTSTSGKEIGPRKMGEPCRCKKNCWELLRDKEETIFNSFWDLADYDLQNTYLFGLITCQKPKRRYKKKTKKEISSRRVSARYYIKLDGTNIKVCKKEFLAVHGLQTSAFRIQLIVDQIAKGITTPKIDGRGRHKSHINQIPEHMLNNIRAHINSIPKYRSHYSREENPNKVYFDEHLNISSLYKDYYLDWCTLNNYTPAKEDKYRRVFCTEFNIGFKLPRSDTCKCCDSLDIKLKSPDITEEEKMSMQAQLQLHQCRAKAMQEKLKTDVQQAKTNKKDVITFDLQQALPTPNLTVGPAFYLRKLWTYNCGIHVCNDGIGHMFMWSEDVAKRGSDEICSVLHKFLADYQPVSEELIVYTDNCGGQNKNWQVMSFWLQLVRTEKYKTVTHNFLVAGHTHLPSDRDFAHIENYKKKMPTVYEPKQWVDAVKKAKRTNAFKVTAMEMDDFFTFKKLENGIKKNTMTTDNALLKFSKVLSFKFDSNFKNSMFIKHAVNEEYKEVKLGKRGFPSNNFNDIGSVVEKKYNEPLLLNNKKLDNLKSFMEYIPPIHQKFYQKLRGFVEAENEESENYKHIEDLE